LNYARFFLLLVSLILSQYSYGQGEVYIFKNSPDLFEKVESNILNEEWNRADSILQLLIDREEDDRTLGITHFYLAQTFETFGRLDKASTALFTAIEYFENCDFQEGLAISNFHLARLYFQRGLLSRADSLLDRSLFNATKVEAHNIMMDALELKAFVYASQGASYKSLDYLKRAYSIAMDIDDLENAGTLVNQLATAHQTSGELDSAIFFFNEALILKMKLNDQQGLISDYSALGNLYRERGDYSEAQANLIAALKIAETKSDSFSLMSIFSEIGDVYMAQNIWDEAETNYSRSLQIAKAKNSRFTIAGSLSKLAAIKRVMEHDSIAVEYYELAFIEYENLGNRTKSADVLIKLSDIYQSSSQLEKARSYLLEALEMREASEDRRSIISIKLALAEIEIDKGNTANGIKLINECLQACEQMNDKDGLKKAYRLMAQAYQMSGDYARAYEYEVRYGRMKDSLISLEQTEVINRLSLKYATEKKDKEIAEQQFEIKSQNLEIQKRNNQLLILAGSLLVVFLVLGFLLFVYLKNKQLSRQKIKTIEKEQEAHALKAMIDGEEQERKRVARELHDGLGAVLATVKMEISGIRDKVPEVDTMAGYLKAEELIDEACRNVREISHDLMPYVLEQQGLEFAINDLCQTLARHNDMTFDFIYFGEEEELSDVLKITIYRIVQELLKNVSKHAAAKEVIVQLTIEEGEVILVVEDDGKGFDRTIQTRGIGLENIRTRVEYLGGSLEVQSEPGKGASFTIYISNNGRQNQNDG
jgi:signal transduction histidine kinase